MYTGFKFLRGQHEEDSNIEDMAILKWLRKHMRITPQLQGDKFFVRQNGLLWATPLFLVLILVEASDVIFAVDSIPAIFAVTTDPFIVLTANLMAILGLRAMFVKTGLLFSKKINIVRHGDIIPGDYIRE